LDLRFFIKVEDELGKARILRVLRSRLVGEWVARGGERGDCKQWHEGLEGELHGFPWWSFGLSLTRPGVFEGSLF